MEKIKNTPFLKLVFSLIFGIIISNYIQLKFSFYFFIPLVLLVTGYFFLVNKRVITKTFISLILFFIVGFSITSLKSENRSLLDYQKIKSYAGIIKEIKEVKNFQKVKVKLSEVENFGFLFLPDSLNIEVDDTIFFSSMLKPIENNLAIGGFDFYKYCIYHDIHFSNFLNDHITIKKNNNKSFITGLKKSIITRLNIIYKNKEVNGVVNALLLGNKLNLDTETKQVFTDVGGMHVLAVSGLHVGFIVLFFNLIFKRLKRFKYGKIMYFILLSFTLVVFSFIVGNTSSVVRSVFMFLLFITSTLLQKKNNSLNILFFCAFVLLVINPYNLFDIGFQLSFLAVLGIIIFYPFLEKLFLPKNIVLKFLWQLNLVSLSAQVFTFPLIIFYFHQFTFLFFISNYITYFLAILLVFATLVLLLVSFLSLNFSFLISDYLITPISLKFLSLLKWISSFDYLVIKNIFSDRIILCLFFTIAIVIVSLFYKFSKVKLYTFLIIVSLILCYHQYLHFLSLKHFSNKFYSYNSSRDLFTYQNGVEAFHFYDDSTSFRSFNNFDREKKILISKYINISDYDNSYLEFDDLVLFLNNNIIELKNLKFKDKEVIIFYKNLNPKKLVDLNKVTQPVKLILNKKGYSSFIKNTNVTILKN